MERLRWILAAAVLTVTGAVWAEATLTVAEAPKAEPAAAPEKASLSEEPLTPEQVQLLNQRIDAGRISIDRLREVIEGQAGAEAVRMSLQDCIRRTIESNPDLQVVRYESLKSDADIFASKGEFDPVVSEMVNYLKSEQQASPEYQRFGGISSLNVERMTRKTSVSGKLQTGTMYDVTLEIDDENTTLTQLAGGGTQYSGGLTLTLSQPLLKGAWFGVNLARIRMAKNARAIAEGQLKIAIMTAISEVVKAYWDLVGAIENVAVREQALANADRLLDIAQKRLDIGSGAALEVLQAKAGVTVRQTELIAARSQVANAEDALKLVLNMRDSDIFSSKRIVPTDRPEVADFDPERFKNVNEQLAQSIDLALKNRPEMNMSELEIATTKLDRTRAANGMLPQIDVTGSVFQGERGAHVNDVFSGISSRKDNFYSIGVRGSIPIGNRAARGIYQRADLTVRQAEQRREKTKQELMLKVRLATRGVNTSQILIESNAQARKLQETNVAAEEKRLRLGVSTSYRVLQMQQDLTAAQTQEVQARIAYEKAFTELRLAEGTLFESLGIEYAAPEPEAPVTFLRSLRPPEPRD